MSLCYLCEPAQVGGETTKTCARCGVAYNVERDEFGLPRTTRAMDANESAIVCTAETLAAIKRNRRASA